MDSIIHKHRGKRSELSNDGGAAVVQEWNETIKANHQGWGPYKTYASFVGIRARDIKTLKNYLKEAGYELDNATGGRAARNTGGQDEDQGGNDGIEADADQGSDDD